MTETVGLLTYPLGEDFGLGHARRRSLRRAYRRALLEKANPRSPDYMRELFASRHPGARVVTTPADAGEDIVLLYPDAIGLGFSSIERAVRSRGSVRALNGRGREFQLDKRARRALLVRRALERSMLGEAAFLCALALATPALSAFDLARGRR